MKRTKDTPVFPPEATAFAPHVIYPSAVYSVAEAQRALHLRESTIRREVREGRLRISKRAGRYFLLGVWLLEWIEEGEIERRRRDGADGHEHNGAPNGRA